MEQSIVDLNQKIDSLTAQVAYLTEQARISERQRQERAELIHDLTPIANQAFEITVNQMEEVKEYIDLSDLVRLFKRLLRNGRNIEKMLDQLESISELVATMSPMANDMFYKVVTSMDDLEQKGYFALARGGKEFIDSVVASFNEEEINRMMEVDISYAGMLRQMRNADVRRGIMLTLGVLKVIGAKASKNGHTGDELGTITNN